MKGITGVQCREDRYMKRSCVNVCTGFIVLFRIFAFHERGDEYLVGEEERRDTSEFILGELITVAVLGSASDRVLRASHASTPATAIDTDGFY